MGRVCLEPRCPEPPVYRGRCREHSRKREKVTHKRNIYGLKRWRILRRSILAKHPLCQHEGCGELATDVDHIVAIEDGGDPWNPEGLQSLCRRHHSAKTAREVRERVY